MNKLPLAKRVQILQLLCEGASMRSISRVCDVSINTVSKLLEDAGLGCAAFHDRTVRKVTVKRVQADEIWAFVGAKQKNVPSMKAPVESAGDVWTLTALDADTKMMLSWSVGGRDADSARVLMDDLSARVANRFQLTTDGHRAYLVAVDEAFQGEVDYGMLNKVYGAAPESLRGRYSPAEFVTCHKEKVVGNPDEFYISTSYVERSNLSMRMGMRRFTRLTNAFSKKLENHYHALSLYFVFYNFVRMHKTLRMTPAMAAGVTDKLMSWEDIAAIVDAANPVPAVRGSYRKRVAASRLGRYRGRRGLERDRHPGGRHVSKRRPRPSRVEPNMETSRRHLYTSSHQFSHLWVCNTRQLRTSPVGS